MKKLRFLLGAVIILGLTGCVKYNAVMDIKKDKSMDFSITYAMQKSIVEMSEDATILSDEDKKNLENNGFSISDYADDEMVGFNIVKNISNIDDVSSSEDVQYSLSNMMESNADQSRMFKVEKGKEKNTYTANFIFNASDSDLSDGDDEDSTEIQDATITTETEEVESTGDLNELGDAMASSMDLKFIVKLPEAAISSNATSTSEDGKELTWDLSANTQDSISFKFSLLNSDTTTVGKTLSGAKNGFSGNMIYFIIGGVGVVVIVLVVLLIANSKKNNSQNVNNDSVMSNSDESNTLVNNNVENEGKSVPVVEEMVNETKEEPVSLDSEVEKPEENSVVEEVSSPIFEEKKVELVSLDDEVEKTEENNVVEEVSSPIFEEKKEEPVSLDNEVEKPEENSVVEEVSSPIFEEKKEEPVSLDSEVEKPEENSVVEEGASPIFEDKKEEPVSLDNDVEKPEEEKVTSSEIFPPVDDKNI